MVVYLSYFICRLRLLYVNVKHLNRNRSSCLLCSACNLTQYALILKSVNRTSHAYAGATWRACMLEIIQPDGTLIRRPCRHIAVPYIPVSKSQGRRVDKRRVMGGWRTVCARSALSCKCCHFVFGFPCMLAGPIGVLRRNEYKDRAAGLAATDISLCYYLFLPGFPGHIPWIPSPKDSLCPGLMQLGLGGVRQFHLERNAI